MTERLVLYRDDQELQANDLNNTGKFSREGMDHVVKDTILDGQGYSGFTVTQRSTVEINIDPGRYYKGGEVFSRDDTVVKSLLASLPLAVKRIVAVVTWGQELEHDVEPRDFLINADTGQTEPKAVAMERRRFAEVNTVAGVESADPQPPILDANVLPFCYVTLGTTGILSIQMLPDYKVPNLGQLDGRVKIVENWKTITEPRISTIQSDIAGLASQMTGLAQQRLVTQIAQDVARIKDELNFDDTFRNYASDNFLTSGESDPTHAGYDALVEEGIRFNWAAQDERALELFNQYDAGVKLHPDGLLLPDYDHAPRLILNNYSGELSVSQYQYQTFNLIKKMMSRTRLRWGPSFQVCTNSAFWQSGVLGWQRVEKSPGQFHVIATLTKNGEVFEIEDPDRALHDAHYWARLKKIWVDTYEEPYWSKVVNRFVVNGSQVAQTFMNAQDGWMTRIGLNFTRLAADGNVEISLVQCWRGQPDPEQVLAHVTLSRADMKLHPEKTFVVIPPTFTKAGERYAVVVTTGANHYVATVTGAEYAQGTLFYCTDGAYFQADFTKDLMLQLDYARFKRSFVTTELKPLQLAGGITAMDILHEGVTPAACQFQYEVQVNGRWFDVDQYEADQLNNYPPMLPLRARFIGSDAVMPGIRLTGSRARVMRPKTTFKHYSSPRTLGYTVTQVVVEERLEWFNEAVHDLSIGLRVGTTEHTPASVVDEVIDVANGYLLRRATFNVAATNTYRVISTGSTNGANNTFHVAQRFDLAK